MSEKLFDMIRKMNLNTIDTQFALQCAPLITGLKISNLLILQNHNAALVGMILNKTGISKIKLSRTQRKTTFLLYRKELLECFLSEKEIDNLLKQFGYQTCDFETILTTFQRRYQRYIFNKTFFPHEIGIFLGYPIEDVKGFIERQGKDYLFSGYWKVYGNPAEKMIIFQEFEIAKELILQYISNGLSITEIIKMFAEPAEIKEKSSFQVYF